MKKNFIAVLVFTFLCVGTLFAQTKKTTGPLRVEIEVESSDDYETKAIPVGEYGVDILRKADSDQKGKDKYLLISYNTDFQKDKENSFFTAKGSELKQFYYDNETKCVYFQFIKGKNKPEYQIVRFDINTSEFKTLSGKLEFPARMFDFAVKKDVVFWSGVSLPYKNKLETCAQYLLCYTVVGGLISLPWMYYTMNRIPVGYIVRNDFNTMQNNFQLMAMEGASRVIDISPDDAGNVDVFTENIIKGGKAPEYKTIYSKKNAQLKDIETSKIPVKEGKFLLSASVSKSRDASILVGSYGEGKINKRVNVKMGYDRQQANGLYFSKIKNGETDFIKFYNFSKFKNYFEYYNDRFKKKMTKKDQKRAAKGKTSIIKSMMLVHDVISLKNGESVVCAEIYYPEYETHCYTTYSANGGASTTCYQVFVGYRYTRALIAGFDKDGELLWDQNFPIGEILTFNLKQRVKVMVGGDETLTFLYNNGGSINSLSIKNGEKITDKEVVKIETNYANDKVKANISSDADFWYGNYFLTYGFQKIKNKEAEKRKRTVFYFNKIAVE